MQASSCKPSWVSRLLASVLDAERNLHLPISSMLKLKLNPSILNDDDNRLQT